MTFGTKYSVHITATAKSGLGAILPVA